MTLIQFKHCTKCYRVSKLIYVCYQKQILVFGQENIFLCSGKLGLLGLFYKNKILIFLSSLSCYNSLPVDAAALLTDASMHVCLELRMRLGRAGTSHLLWPVAPVATHRPTGISRTLPGQSCPIMWASFCQAPSL